MKDGERKEDVEFDFFNQKKEKYAFEISQEKFEFSLDLDQPSTQVDQPKTCPCQQSASKPCYAFDNLAYGSMVNNKH